MFDRGLCHAAYQCGGGGLTGRTGDADDRAGDAFHEYLGVVGDRDAPAVCFPDQRQRQRDTAGDTHQVSAIQQG